MSPNEQQKKEASTEYPATKPQKAASEDTSSWQGLTARALILSIGLTVACGFWVKQAEIVVRATQVTESVPAIPGLAALILLLFLNPILHRISKLWSLTRGELVLVYCFVVTAISLAGCGIIRFWFSLVSAPFYFATPENRLAELHQWMPGWLIPNNPQVMHDLYEGSATGAVPWGAWLVPMLSWTGFFLILWLTMLCLVVLVRRRWVEQEWLTFPIVYLPLQITDVEGPGRLAKFFRDPVMWGGFSIAFLFNLVNMLHSLTPVVPAIGSHLALGNPQLFGAWKPLAEVFRVSHRPELIGFGFLVPTEVSFSIWFFYLLSKAEACLAIAMGYDVPGLPFEHEQSIGAFIALAALLLWAIRKPFVQGLRAWFQPVSGLPPDDQELIPYRWAAVGVLAGFVAICIFCRLAGMPIWLAAFYFGMLLLIALVSARIRAEVGAPLIWVFPYGQAYRTVLYTLGSRALTPGGSLGPMTMLTTMYLFSRGYFPSLIGYQIESVKLGQATKVKPRHMAWVLVLALLVGLWVAFYAHITPYYELGGQYLRDGIWGSSEATTQYIKAVNAPTLPIPRDAVRIGVSTFGLVFASALTWLRANFVGLPFHPLGYALATLYGRLLWWPFFVVWLLKSLILRYGGIRLYRRAVPGFLGLALGHFFTAGIVWGLLGASGGALFHGYSVIFG